MDFASRLRDLPELETPRLLLRRMSVDDAKAMFDYARLPRVSQYCSWDYHRTIDDTRAFLKLRESAAGTDSVCDWAVVEKETGRMVGTGGFVEFEPSTRTGEIGYVLHPDVWGRGYASELAKRFVVWGFQSNDLHRIIAHCIPANHASARVLEKNGFHRDGTMRASFRKQGIFVDVHEYSLLRSDRGGGEWEFGSLIDERARIEELTLLAFQYDAQTRQPISGVEPSELAMVRALFDEGAIVRGHIARVDGVIVGYILYVAGKHREQPDLQVLTLAIMGVHPLAQRCGWGTRLLEHSVRDMHGSCDLITVLGHPDFYPRAGFVPMSRWGLHFTHAAPASACMGARLSKRDIRPGTIEFHPLIEQLFPPEGEKTT